jgi:hypothetical protein
MKCLSILLSFALVIATVGIAQDDAAKEPITLEELHSRGVLGRLGVPLGTAVKIEAVVLSGDALRMKRFQGQYLLEVKRVGGKELTVSPKMLFGVAQGLSWGELPETKRELWDFVESKQEKEEGELNSSEFKESEKRFVGKKVWLVVYEIGEFRGHPNGVPRGKLGWADTNFGFSTSLIVIGKVGSIPVLRDNAP